MLIWLWPRISISTRGATPAAVSRVAQPCRAVQTDRAEAGRGGEPGEGAVQVPRLDGAAGAGGEYEAGRVQLGAPLLCLVGLAEPVPAESGQADQGQRYGADLPGLGGVLVQLAADALHLVADADHSVVQVHVRPAQAEDLTAAEAHGDGEDEGRVERIAAGLFEECKRLVQRPGRCLAADDLGDSTSEATLRVTNSSRVAAVRAARSTR